MIYQPLLDINEIDEIYYFCLDFLRNNRDNMSWSDRIDAALFALEYMGYSWQEYADERRKRMEWKQNKKEWKEWRPNDKSDFGVDTIR